MAKTTISEDLRLKVINDFNIGLKQKTICDKYSLKKSAVSKIIKKYRETGSVKVQHIGGRPRKTSQRQDKLISREFKKCPKITPREIINNLGLEVSTQTVCRRATEAGLGCYRSAKKPLITKKNRNARIKFAKEHLNWTRQMWNTVLFSDESKYNLRGNDGRLFVRRPKGKRLDPKYTSKTVKFGGGNIKVWGCFSGQGMGPIHVIKDTLTGLGYRSILNDVMYPYAEENMPLIWRFQHDNDPKHTSKVVTEWLQSNEVRVLKWPAQSPDLNPIENLWEIVDRKIRVQNYTRKDDLANAVVSEWEKIPMETIDSLIDSMPRRCEAVIKNKGYPTKY